ncbi:MAG: SiaB family protein kinase [Dokdonella sp.]
MNLFALKEQLREAGILISFTGSFSHSIIEELGTAVKKYLESAESQKTAMVDVFSVYIEAAQNVRNYSERRLVAGQNDIDSSIVVIAKRDTRYRIYAGNVVEAEDTAELGARLDRLAVMDKPALKEAYKEQRRKERGPDDLGAGLGLIEIARRATQPLEYTFTPLPDGRAYFSLCVEI